jgi:gas vesicle protein
MNIDSKKARRIARAIVAGDIDFNVPSKSSYRVPIFLAGLGAGAVLGMLFAPSSGEETRTNLSERAKQGFEVAKSKGQEFSRRAQKAVGRGKEQVSQAVDTAKESYYEDKAQVS